MRSWGLFIYKSYIIFKNLNWISVRVKTRLLFYLKIVSNELQAILKKKWSDSRKSDGRNSIFFNNLNNSFDFLFAQRTAFLDPDVLIAAQTNSVVFAWLKDNGASGWVTNDTSLVGGNILFGFLKSLGKEVDVPSGPPMDPFAQVVK